LGLWKAAKSFDVERGISFATYACKCIDNQILMLLRRRKKEKSEISLDWILSENSDGNPLRLRDVLVSDISSHDKDVDGDTIKLLLHQVAKGQGVDVRAFRMYYFYGCSQGEIAKRLGISQSYVSRIINRTKRKYAKLLIANDLLSKDFLEDYKSSRYRGRSESVI
jgi:RNA polymerase sporulation-specific sigma factor